ncbi:hypothetical protein ABQD63_10450 [Lactococcus garvieae]|uniref:hypothetical protein n=1 Tax=Lactococcus TaxID=1357 RepID=UPI0030D52BB0
MANNKRNSWNPKVRTFFHDGEDQVENRMIPTGHNWYNLRVKFAKETQVRKAG